MKKSATVQEMLYEQSMLLIVVVQKKGRGMISCPFTHCYA